MSRSFANRAVWLLAFLALAAPAFACPGCTTYQRMLLGHWHEKMFVLQIAAALAFTANRLDFVRVLLVFVPLAAMNVYLQSSTMRFLDAMFFMRPPSQPPGPLAILNTLGAWAVALNVLGAATMFAMGTLPFFRRDKEKGLPLWQAIAYAATVFFASAFIQLM